MFRLCFPRIGAPSAVQNECQHSLQRHVSHLYYPTEDSNALDERSGLGGLRYTPSHLRGREIGGIGQKRGFRSGPMGATVLAPRKCTTGSDTVATPQRRTATPQTGWAGPGSLGIRRPTHEVPSCRQNDRLQGGGKCWQGRQNEPRRRTTPLQLANCPLLILTTTPEVVGGAAMAGMSSSEARNARSRSRGRNRANLVHRPFGSGKGAERATDRPISPDHSNKLLPLFQEMAAAQRTRANDRR